MLNRFGPFWIMSNIKIDENHRETKFLIILMKFETRNPFFEKHFIISDHFELFLIILDRFWTVLDH